MPRLPAAERVGPPDCPLMYRWTLLSGRLGKLLVHHFLPLARDRDTHDHPASFVTFVLRGGYDDEQEGGRVDRVRAPAVRVRRAEHAHRTVAGSRGAWSVVVMGPKRRDWGFWRHGRWFRVDAYERIFGFAFRCADLPKEYRPQPAEPS